MALKCSKTNLLVVFQQMKRCSEQEMLQRLSEVLESSAAILLRAQ
jgi:hypothetical protein